MTIGRKTPVPTNLNTPFVLLVIGLCAGIVIAAQAGVDPRLLAALAGIGALGGLAYRLISTWPEVPVLVHVLALSLIALLLVEVIAHLELLQADPPVPLTASVWPVITVRVACIVVAVFWPRWVDRRMSPFRREAD